MEKTDSIFTATQPLPQFTDIEVRCLWQRGHNPSQFDKSKTVNWKSEKWQIV